MVVELNRQCLRITASLANSSVVKLIEVEKGEALAFLREECEGKLENVF